MLLKIKNLINRFILKYKMFKMDVSPKGEYFIKYLIDVYINCTINELNEIYEERIRDKEEKIINNAKYIKEFQKLNTEEEQEYIHFHAAMTILITLLFVHKNKNKWIDYINNEERKNFIKNLLK